MKKQIDEKLLKNNIGDYEFNAYPFENLYKEILSKKSKKESFIRISSSVFYDGLFFNFKIQTKTQTGYFKIEPALGDTDSLWKFLEDICVGKKETEFLSEQEGSNSLLISKEVDKQNIRLILICNMWVEPIKEQNNKIRLVKKYFQNHKQNVLLDTIINKRDFVYNFYCALRDIFINDNYEYVEIKHISWQEDKAQADSLIIREYLGYIEATKKDLELLQSIYSKDFIKTKLLLENGANPNAMIDINEFYKKSIFELFFEKYWESLFVENKTPIVEQEKIYFNFVKIFIKYGAKPRRFFDVLNNGIESDEIRFQVVKYLLDNNCFFDYFSMSDCYFESYYNNVGMFYKRVLELLEKYLYSWFIILDGYDIEYSEWNNNNWEQFVQSFAKKGR